jgi:hypothetical protein
MMKSIFTATALVAFGFFGLFGTESVTHLAASLVVKSGDSVRGVGVELRKKSTEEVVARATTDADGKFSFPDVPEGEYTLALTLPEKPGVKKCRLTLSAGRGGQLKKDFDFKAVKPSPSGINKLPGKPKPGEITLTRSTIDFEGGGAVAGVITVR